MGLLRNKSVFITVSILLTIAIIQILPANYASATVSDWQAGNIISNYVMSNSSSMSAADIQSFLNSKVTSCDTYHTGFYGSSGTWYGPPFICLKDYTENGLTAAQIIYNTAQTYHINPQVLLVVLQKEQSLVTDTWPASFQYKTATGYGCPDTSACDSTYYGFTNQVGWTAKMFRSILNQSSTWYSPYTVGNNTILYSPTTSCGSSNVYIENLATAALYSYTPYQPNQASLNADFGSGDSCSSYGNRNFYLYFTNWFGNPRANSEYAWSIYSNDVYYDENRTAKFTDGIFLNPGQKAYITIKANNLGSDTWDSNVRLGTASPSDHSSVFADSTWMNSGRIALATQNISSGSTGTFSFSITAPNTIGTYTEKFNMVADGKTWFNNLGLTYTINVMNPRTALSTNTELAQGSTLSTGQYILSPGTNSILILQSDGNLVLYRDFKAVWSSGTAGTGNNNYLVLQGDGNLVLYTNSGQAVWSGGTDGKGGTHLVMQGDGNLVLYTADGSAVWNTGTTTVPDDLHYNNDTVPVGSTLYTGQAITTINQKLLILQGDGNLVYYNAFGKAIWSSGTDGKGGTRLVMQGDGNLVLYTNNDKAVWNTGTNGKGGTRLVMQGDGNLVLYTNSGNAIWSSGTNGKGDDSTESTNSSTILASTKTLNQGDSLSSTKGKFILQGDGNLVLYTNNGRAVWSSGTDGKGGTRLVMQGDGNLVLYTSGGAAVWSSGTAGTGNNNYLVLQDDGNLVLYTNSGKAVWGSGTDGKL